MKTRVLRRGSVKGAYSPSSNHPFYGWHRLARDFIGFNNKKGEVYEENFFEKKNPFFKSKAFTDEIKEFYAGKMNEKLKDADYKMQIFDKDEPYLPLKRLARIIRMRSSLKKATSRD